MDGAEIGEGKDDADTRDVTDGADAAVRGGSAVIHDNPPRSGAAKITAKAILPVIPGSYGSRWRSVDRDTRQRERLPILFGRIAGCETRESGVDGLDQRRRNFANPKQGDEVTEAPMPRVAESLPRVD
jgi:hypothetical protein